VEWAVVGANCHLEADVEIKRSIVWENVVVKRNAKITDSIVTSSTLVEKDLVREIR
jgi:mannose-1-phosphate guanylyltransferase/phosphomannomutase